MKSLTVQGIEEWLFSDFYLQTNKHLNLRDNLLYTSIFHTKVKWQHTVNISNFYHEKSDITTSLISNKLDFKTRAPRGTDRSPEYNEHFC